MNERAALSVQVAHVTFFIVESPDLEEYFDLYSESRQGKKQKLNTFSCSYDDISALLEEEMDKLSAILDRKRDGLPTPKQLMFLFREKIPIPLDLTWGEASNLIDDRLMQIKKEKQEKRERKLQVKRQYNAGDKVIHAQFGVGIVLKSEVWENTEFLEVQFQDSQKRLCVDYAKLEKVQSSIIITPIDTPF